ERPTPTPGAQTDPAVATSAAVKPTEGALAEAEVVAGESQGGVAIFEDAATSLAGRVQRFLHAQPIAGPAMVLVLAIGVFGVVAENFLTAFNASLVVQQVMIIGTLGVAQTIVILTAGIDLSVGAIMVLTSTFMGRLAVVHGVPPLAALLIGLAVGAGCGLINAVLVTRVKLPPFIVTLGTWQIFFALNLFYSRSETIRSQDVAATAPLLQYLGRSFAVGGARITYGSILLILLVAFFAYLLKWTAWGVHVYAVGDDPESARLSGIRTDRVLTSVYVVAGIICAIAAWALIGRIGSISPQAGQEANLDSISAVVIGGTSLFGGRGRVVGTLLGALTVGVFRNGLALAGVDVLWQTFTVGLLIIAAVSIDQWIRRVSA
ncbi:MAG TPA: ABC transporter permease, partial [Euzebya sp.]|nr:ABC transporter permease [Euzebya sp.]